MAKTNNEDFNYGEYATIPNKLNRENRTCIQ